MITISHSSLVDLQLKKSTETTKAVQIMLMHTTFSFLQNYQCTYSFFNGKKKHFYFLLKYISLLKSRMWILLTPLATSGVTQCSIFEAAFSSLQSGPATIPPRSLWRDEWKRRAALFLPNTWQSRARGALVPSGSELSSQAWTDTRAGKRATFKACLYTCVCAITSGSWKEIFLFFLFTAEAEEEK